MFDFLADIIPIPGFTEPFSSLSHLISAGVFLILGIFLVYRGRGHIARTISLCVFVFGTVFLLSMSGTYHLLDNNTTARDVLQRLDHAAIFVLIASSFTPLHTILFAGKFWRGGMIFLIWTVAITSLTLKSIFFNDMPEWLGLTLYLGMGWVGLFSGLMIFKSHGWKITKYILYGGMAYSVGAIAEFAKQPIIFSGIIEAHELFHIFVLIGLTMHWYAVFLIANHPLAKKEAHLDDPI